MDSVTRKVVQLGPCGDGLDPNHRPQNTFFLHFSNQLFICYDCLTIFRLDVKWVSDFQQVLQSAD